MIFLILAIWISIGMYITYTTPAREVIDKSDMSLPWLYFWTLIAVIIAPIYLVYARIKHTFL